MDKQRKKVFLKKLDRVEKGLNKSEGGCNMKYAAWMTMTMVEGFYKPDGTWCSGVVHGYIKLVTDKEFKEGFHSTEKWQLLVYGSEDIKGLPRMIIPGCKVRVLILWKNQCSEGIELNLEPGHYDARIYSL